MRSTVLLPHRIVVSHRTPIVGETAYEKVTTALLTGLLLLCLVCGLLVAIWLQFDWHLSTHDGSPPSPGNNGGSMTIATERSNLHKPLVAAAVSPPLQLTEHETSHPERPVEQLINAIEDSAVDASSIGTDSSSHLSGMEFSETAGEKDSGNSKLWRARKIRRWFFNVQAPRNAAEYTRMVNEAGIELGALFPDGRLVYLSHSNGVASVRTASATLDNRYFTVWSRGELQQLDEELFREAGVDIAGAQIVHLFSPRLEQDLIRRELAFAGRSADMIQRTWFRIEPAHGAFEVSVVRQTGFDQP